MNVDVLLQNANVNVALDVLNAQIDQLRSKEEKMSEIVVQEKFYVDSAAVDAHGQFVCIVGDLPNKQFNGKNGPYQKNQVEVEFVKDKARKTWTLDAVSTKRLLAERPGNDTKNFIGLYVRYEKALRANGEYSIIGSPVSADLVRAATQPQQLLGGGQ